MSTTVQRIAVVGSGSVAWLAAAALKLAFRHRNLDVAVLDGGDVSDEPLARWTLPSVRSMYALLGIRESTLLRETSGTFKLASEHVHWQADGSRFMHAHGELGTPINRIPFYKYLLLRAIAGHAEPPDVYSLAATAAQMGRFARPMESKTALTSSFTYAFHLEEAPHREFLRKHAESLGVRRITGTLTGISRLDNGNVGSLLVDSEPAVMADYFLDCSGHQALLMNQLSPGEYEDWSQWLPADRMLAVRASALPAAPAVTQTAATTAGWFWRIPLQQSSVAGYVYSSKILTDDDARQQLHRFAGASADSVVQSISAGRRRSFWEANCIAMGSTAVGLEPLAGADFHLAQLGIATLIELFPLHAHSRLEAVEYNRALSTSADSLRDFTIAHYRAGRLRDGEFWALARSQPDPDSLLEKLDLFRANGRINLRDDEIFEEADWAWLLLGSGCLPSSLELHTREKLGNAGPEQFAPLRTAIQSLVSSMPRHMEYFQRRA